MSEATQWHRRPNLNELCAICEAPVWDVNGSRILDHRSVDPSEGISADWIARRKSGTGWKYTRITRVDSNPQPLRLISHARRNSLARYYHHIFEPANLRSKSHFTRREYEKAIAKLCEFARRDVSIGECNERLIDRFCEWAICDGLLYETVRHYRAYLRRVVRAARPGVCEKQSGKRPHEAEPVGNIDKALDVEGSLWRFFHEVYKPIRLIDRPQTTVDSYIQIVRRLCRHVGRSVLVCELSDDLVSSHISRLLEGDLSAQTANSSLRHILALWRFAYKRKLIDTLPQVELLPIPKRQPRAWSVAQIGMILASCQEETGYVGTIPAAKWWQALILTIYDTGLRKNAALMLEREHVDLSERWLFVPADHQKQNAEQNFRLSNQTIDAIHEIWRPARQLLFPWPGGSRSSQIWRVYGKILHRAGLPSGPRDKFHKIRRTTATQIAIAAGAGAASHQLGHSSETITKGYIDPRFTSTHDASSILPRPQVDPKGGKS
ncbi:MAG: site-specific integrase [Planctomycetaceae bacterium]|nr:site-specific integrase [Planctomycetales bacterium]MCB9927188.1 site-specific integrase [Planctomycetaceae bacterium]